MRLLSHLASVTLITVLAATRFAAAEELVVYTALEEDELAAYTKAWSAGHADITLKIVRESTGIVTAKLLAEQDNPQADVVWGLAATSLLVADQRGMLAAYKPAGFEAVNPEFKDTVNAEPHWTGIKTWETGFVTNTVEAEKLKLAAPTSYADLLKPEYKGKLVMPNPASSGTGFLTVSAILQLNGEEKGWAYLDALHANIAQYTHSGSKPAKLAGKGEFPVGISFAYRGFTQKAKGEPVVVTFPSEGCGWDVEANALIKKPQVKAATKAFLDWAISEEAMVLYAKSYPIVARPVNVAPPAGYPTDTKHLIKNNLLWAAEHREAILAEWSKRYDGKSEPKKK